MFGFERINRLFARLRYTRLGLWGIVPACVLGIASPLCMYGTIPLLQQWLYDGMGVGSAAAFMITGPATKITNLGAVKIVLGGRRFAMYVLFVIAYAVAVGVLIDSVVIAY